MKFFNKFLSISVATVVALTAAALPVTTAQAAPKPKVSIGASLANGAPVSLALTTKYKNKTATIELGTLVKRKLKFVRLATARLSSTGVATICTTKSIPSTAVVRVKVGSKIVTEAKAKTRSAIAACPLLAPASLDLAIASDSGVSASDNITNASELTVAGTAFPLAAVTFFSGATQLDASCSANALGAFSCALPVNLQEGVHVLTAKSSITGALSQASAPLTVTVDRTKPTLNWTWVESEIGRGGTVHSTIVPSEPIYGFTVDDIKKNSSAAFAPLEIRELVEAAGTFSFKLLAHEYEATDVNLFMNADAVTDAAGNLSAGTHTVLGERFTYSPTLNLDYSGPVLTSALVEVIDAPVDYGKITFTLDEKLVNASLDDFSINVYQIQYGGLYVRDVVPLSNYVTTLNLYTDDNQTFWIFTSAWNAHLMLDPSQTNNYHAVVISGTVYDEYGYPGGGSEARIGPWPEGY